MYPTISVTPPIFAEQCIEEQITCIRAHRERIFQVAVQSTASRTIFHNYGQGGAGWTFLFGCVHESMRQFTHLQIPRNKPICVIGAGCYGLLTASMLAHAGYAVRIIARETDNITSDKAAGFFFPRPRKSSTPEERALFTARGLESYSTYQAIMHGNHPFITRGAQELPAYFGMDIDPGFAPYIAAGLIQPPKQVTIDFGNSKRYDMMQYQLLFINTAQLMSALRTTVQSLQIPIIQQEVENFDEISESIIFNCAGLGAKKLTGDARLIPVQGHLIALKNQPPQEQMQYMINVKVTMFDGKTPRDELIYYAPKKSGIVGITFKRGEGNLNANAHEFDRLLQRCHDFFGT